MMFVDLNTLLLQVLAIAIAAFGSFNVVRVAGSLSLSLALYFSLGGYTATWIWNSLSQGSPLFVLPVGIVSGCVVAVAASVPNLFARKVRLDGQSFGLFSLAYGYGMWLLIVTTQVFVSGRQIEGIGLTNGHVAEFKGPVVGVLFVLVGGWAMLQRRHWRTIALSWINDGMADLSIYNISSVKLLNIYEIQAAIGCAMSGAVLSLVLGTTESTWGGPAQLVVLYLATLISFRAFPVTVLLGSFVVVTLRPVVSATLDGRWASLDLVVFGAILFVISLRKTEERRALRRR